MLFSVMAVHSHQQSVIVRYYFTLMCWSWAVLSLLQVPGLAGCKKVSGAELAAAPDRDTWPHRSYEAFSHPAFSSVSFIYIPFLWALQFPSFSVFFPPFSFFIFLHKICFSSKAQLHIILLWGKIKTLVLKYVYYLFIDLKNIGTDRNGEIIHELVHFPNHCSHQSWAKLKPGATSRSAMQRAKYLSHFLLDVVLPRSWVENGTAGNQTGTHTGCWYCRLRLYLLCHSTNPWNQTLYYN